MPSNRNGVITHSCKAAAAHRRNCGFCNAVNAPRRTAVLPVIRRCGLAGCRYYGSPLLRIAGLAAVRSAVFAVIRFCGFAAGRPIHGWGPGRWPAMRLAAIPALRIAARLELP
jgi:hypothetical protein